MFEIAKDVFAAIGVAAVLVGGACFIGAKVINRLGQDGQIP